MKRLLYVFMALCLFASIAGAGLPGLKLHWEMDSADDFNLGQDVGGFAGRTYVTNSVTNFKTAGMTAAANVFFDAQHKALRISTSDTASKIMGLSGNTYGESPSSIFTNETQYTFSLWAKGDLGAVMGNGYSFYVFWSDGNKFKCDLGFKYNQSAAFSAPGNVWAGGATNIWDPNNTARYVNPESWNMYTFTWDADNNQIASYVNGVLRGSWGDNDGNDIPALAAGATVTDFGFGDGYGWQSPGGWYRNFRIWDEALDAVAVADLVGDFFSYAQDPSPADLSDFVTDADTFDLALSWQAGTYAASHDLYIGTDFDDVNDADNMSPEFQGSIANSSYNITVTSGSTYYWRVDEVNDIDIWKGDVWSFTVIGVPDPVLLWEMDSADDFTVGDGTGGSASGRLYVTNNASGYKYAGMTATSGIQYDADEGAVYMNGVHPCKIYGMAPGNLIGEDPNDIFTSSTQYTFSLFAKGDKSAVVGNGYSFYLFFGAAQRFKCDLSWLPQNSASFSSPGGGWQSSAYNIWKPEVPDRYVDPETWNMYTFVWDVDNQFIATYVNGVLRGGPMFAGTAIAAGQAVTDFGFGDGYGWSGPGGWFKDYRVYDEALNADQIQFILGDFLYYPKNPSPKNGATAVALDGTVLTWTHGLGAVSQDVYFGENYNDVNNADLSSPTYKGQIAVDTFDPGSLELFKTYYWRVDQLDENGDLIVKGPVWQFSSIESIMVDDFESYDAEGNDITAVWTDKIGWGDMEITLVQDQVLSPVNAMSLRYHLPDEPWYTIAARSFSPAQDWTANGVKILTIHCYGNADNFGLPLFVTIGDGTTDANVVVDVDTLAAGWGEINVSLPEIAAAGVDLTNVSYMEIGFGNGTDLGMYYTKWDYLNIDDIALYPAKCVLSESSLLADITGDCVVNYDDLDALAFNWLLSGYTVSAAASVSDDDMVLHYDFENNTTDSVAGNNGTLNNFGSAANYGTGHTGTGKCIHFNATGGTSGSNMTVPPAAFADVNEEVTFSFWLKNDTAAPAWYMNVFGGQDIAGGRNHLFMLYSPAEQTNMVSVFHCGSAGNTSWSQWDNVTFTQPVTFDYTAWNHFALVKNCLHGEIWYYTNGELMAYKRGAMNKMYGCDEFKLGSLYGDAAFFTGSVDDFRVYNRALSHAEVLNLAGQSTATVALSELKAEDSDLNTDDAVDFKDYAILANEWLVEDLWP